MPNFNITDNFHDDTTFFATNFIEKYFIVLFY